MPIASTESTDQGPHHLAKIVHRALSVGALEPPDEWLLGFFFDVLYQASFRTENGQPLTGRVLWQSQRSRMDPAKSGHLLLLQPVPFNVSSLAALLPAGDAHESALLVSGGEGQPLVISGIVRCGGLVCPQTLFCAEILGPAHLKVDAGLDYPLELRRNRLHLSVQKVFERGPVRERLSALLQNLFPTVQALLPGDIAASPVLSARSLPLPGGNVLINDQDWPEILEQFWINALTGLLQQVYDRRGGGSVLLTVRQEQKLHQGAGMTPAHEAAFTQLRHLLETRAVQAIAEQVQAVRSLSERAGSLKDIPLDDLTLQDPAFPLTPPDRDPEIVSAMKFLAGLSRVDGLLRLDPHLDLLSFGGQPGEGRLPERVYLAGTELAEDADLSPLSPRSFGPRNQALLRQCYQDPDSLGFAFTQDGEIRAMLWHDEKLLIWSSVLLPRS